MIVKMQRTLEKLLTERYGKPWKKTIVRTILETLGKTFHRKICANLGKDYLQKDSGNLGNTIDKKIRETLEKTIDRKIIRKSPLMKDKYINTKPKKVEGICTAMDKVPINL